jgi:hypothetical protein
MAQRADDGELISLAEILTEVSRRDEEVGAKLTLRTARIMAKRNVPNKPIGGAEPPGKDETWPEGEPQNTSPSEEADSPGEKSRVDLMLEEDALELEARRARLRGARAGRG